jgi:methylated-DNA-[protein]-cysteine S-methyltransferase
MMKKKTKNDAGKYYSLFKTETGFGAVIASDEGLLEVLLPVTQSAGEMQKYISGLYPAATTESPLTKQAADLLKRYFKGEAVKFDLPLDFSACTLFQQEVYQAVGNIPYGAMKSYKSVAVGMDRPKASRGIGSAMARNPLPIIIPCHRVVGSSGAMTGYSAPGGVEMKKRLLLMEGVKLEKSGKRGNKY